MRTPDEHPLLVRDLELCRQYFGNVDARCFHIAVLLAAAIHGKRAFAPAMRVLQAVDRALLRMIPPLRRYAWVTVLSLEQRIARVIGPTASSESQPGLPDGALDFRLSAGVG
ncbi:MAG: hypothetical protein ACXVDD_17865 [Polyangia bacterium]